MKINFEQTSSTQEQEQNLIPNLPERYQEYFIEPAIEGVSTNVYKMTLGNSTKYLRIKRHEEGISAELLAHNSMEEHGVLVPHIEFTSSGNKNTPAYMIVSEIPGNSIKNNWGKITEKEKENILNKAGKDIARFQEVPVSGFGVIDQYTPDIQKLHGVLDSYHNFICIDFKTSISTIEEYSTISPEYIELLKKVYINFQQLLDIPENQMVLAHGDLGLSHIYCEDGEYTGIIDFGDIAAASKFHDLAHIYLYGHDGFEYIKNGYSSVNDLPDNHMQHIEFEGLLIAIQKLYKRIDRNFPQEDINKKEKQLLEYIKRLEHII